MSGLPLGIRFKKIVAEIELQERVVHLVAASLDAPSFVENGRSPPGYRFADPGWKHFCLLKSVRAVSGLNTCAHLTSGGFNQEMVVLVRTITECTTQIEFVLAGLEGDELADAQRDFVRAYFADSERDGSGRSVRLPFRQGEVHKVVGRHTDELVRRVDLKGEFSGIESEKLHSKTYLTNSNYVHSRYPEVMDMFGGREPRFHLRGMRGTPKDFESVEILEAFAVTVSHALRYLVLVLGLVGAVRQDVELANWYPPEAA